MLKLWRDEDNWVIQAGSGLKVQTIIVTTGNWTPVVPNEDYKGLEMALRSGGAFRLSHDDNGGGAEALYRTVAAGGNYALPMAGQGGVAALYVQAVDAEDILEIGVLL